MNKSNPNLSYISDLENIPWAGILFSPKLSDAKNYPEKYFELSNCKGALFLVDKYIDIYNTQYSNLQFYLAPDVADTALPSNSELYESIINIKNFAKGRKIISLLGSLAPHKGVIDFIRVSMKADPRQYCFVMVGKLRLDLFSETEKILINTSFKENKNLFYHTEYIEDEAEYNSIYTISDVIFSVYNDFDSSSNTLTKAAYFHVPILADAKSTVGNRVEEFKLGETAIQNNIDSILSALERICSTPRNNYNYELYKNSHSFESLKNVLDHATKSWLK